MKLLLKLLFTLSLLLVGSLTSWADVKILYGEKGSETFKDDGGKIEASQKPSDDGSKVTIYLTVTPNENYTLEKDGIEAYEVISADAASTRAPEISGKLKVNCDDFVSSSQKRTYYVTIDAGLDLWVKKVDFVSSSKGPQRGIISDGLYYIKSNANNKDYYLCPAIGCYYDNNVDQPHLTTFQTSGDQNSVWEIKFVETVNSVNYYYLIHYKTGKYLKSNSGFSIDGGSNRKAVHLEEKPSSLDEYYEFCINDNSGIYQIYPKTYDSDASSLSFNARGGNQAYYVPQNGLAMGIIGLYPYSSGGTGSQWLLSQVVSQTCATPIVKYEGDNIKISYPYSDETGITIYYTTDGTVPTASSAHEASNSFNISASGVVKVRAFAAKTGYANSDEAVLWGSARPFLIQSKEDANYYLVPSGAGTNVNTSSIAGEPMQWTLQNAGASTGGVPYYYLVSSNGLKISYNSSDNTLVLNESSEDANKFCIVEDGNSGEFFIIPATGASTGTSGVCKNVFKNNGNVASDNATVQDVKANSADNINRSHWRFIVCNDGADQKGLFANPPFSVSDDDETHYYHIQNVGNAGYYIIPPSTDDGYATTSNTSNDYTSSPWLFKVASTDNWLNYYYIINAATGKYMHFNIDNGKTTDQTNVISMKDISEKNAANEEKFQFIMVRSTTTDAYYIVPKGYANNFNQSRYFCLWENNGNALKSTWSRSSSAKHVKWTFSEATITSLYLDPVVTQDEQGNITFNHPTNACDYYYTTDGMTDPTVPASSETDPTAPTSKYTGAFLPETGVTQIRVIAVSKGNYGVTSNVVTYDLPQLSQPTIAFDNTSNTVTITSLTGATIYYAYGDTEPDNPTATESITHDTGSVSFVISDKTYVKALAVKEGFATSEVLSHVIDKVATPSKSVTPDNKVTLTCATSGVTFYYTIGDTEPADPTTASTRYTSPIENASGKYIKVIAVKEGWIYSDVYSSGEIRLQCATPVIKRETGDKFSISCAFPVEGVRIYYTMGNTAPDDPTLNSSLYSTPVNISSYPITVKAIAIADGYENSVIAEKTITAELTPEDGYYEIASVGDFALFVTLANTEEGAAYNYRVTDDITISSTDAITRAFTGSFDGGLHTISGLGHALFNSVNGGTVKNVILDNVSISSGTNVGAIANEATGTSSQKAYIYNCGILSGSVGGNGYVGGIVGQLGSSSDNDQCYACVINCFSYASITSGTNVGGIVGYNSYASKSNDIRTMVMNCMFYGDISASGDKAPIYNGSSIDNFYTDDTNRGLNNYNYFRFDKPYVSNIGHYNCALGAEDRYLDRFEFFRHTLNSNRELAAWYVTGNADDGKGYDNIMAKWVVDKTIAPYSVLKPQGSYPSVVNHDAVNAAIIGDESVNHDKGLKFGSLNVNISLGTGAPSGASLNESSLSLNITDKNTANYDFNYRKVQLPYYNEVGTGNYTHNKVVTGWKITVSGGTNSFTTGTDYPAYNFVDRKCTDKDNYATSGRVFSQGAYYEVPDEVSTISIEAYWADCVYLADASLDVTYNTAYSTESQSAIAHYTDGESYSINGDDQVVYTTFDNAMTALAPSSSNNVYDKAIVLVGNYH